MLAADREDFANARNEHPFAPRPNAGGTATEHHWRDAFSWTPGAKRFKFNRAETV